MAYRATVPQHPRSFWGAELRYNMSRREPRRKRTQSAEQDAEQSVALQRNNTSFPAQSTALLRELYDAYRAAKSRGDVWAHLLKYYQYFTRTAMVDPRFGVGDIPADLDITDKRQGAGTRGFLVYYDMGMGKTRLAVAAAMAMWDVRSPLVVLSRSLRDNFISTVREVTGLVSGLAGDDLRRAQDEAVHRFRFISADAYNMADQVAKLGSLNNRFVIVDEAHDFFRGIINSGGEDTNAMRLYRSIQEAENLRLMFLTGTPSSKNPFELVPCFNMLTRRNDFLPAVYETFTELYIDAEAGQLRNAARLANRLVGLVSHVTHRMPVEPGARPDASVAHVSDASITHVSDASITHVSDGVTIQEEPVADIDQPLRPRDDGWFPELYPTRVVRVPMSRDQFYTYLRARAAERAEMAPTPGAPRRGGPGAAPRASAPLSLPGSERERASTYYVRSRLSGNFAPAGVLGVPPNIDKMAPEEFTAERSPKMVFATRITVEAPGIVLIYSEFAGIGGVASMARYLDNAGMRRWRPGAPAGHSASPTVLARVNGTWREYEVHRLSGEERDVPRRAITARVGHPDPRAGTLVLAEVGQGEYDVVAGWHYDATDELAPDAVVRARVVPPDVLAAAAVPLHYALISGEVDPAERAAIVKQMNSAANLRGSLVRALLVTKTGAQGLDLKNVRVVILIEAPWSKSREHQLVARAVRLGSANALPRDDRDVQPYLLLAVPNVAAQEELPPEAREPLSTDEQFHARAIKQLRLNMAMRDLLRRVSLECEAFGYGADCHRCVPTGERLFDPDPARDVRSSTNTCVPPTDKEITVMPIKLPGSDVQYYYSADPSAPGGVRVYRHRADIDAFVEMMPVDGDYDALVALAKGAASGDAEDHPDASLEGGGHGKHDNRGNHDSALTHDERAAGAAEAAAPRRAPPRYLAIGAADTDAAQYASKELKYRPGLRERAVPHLGTHTGQRKLFDTEVSFLVDHEAPLMVYAGAAPSIHMVELLRCFPKLHVWLVDPAKFCPEIVRMSKMPQRRVRIYNEYCTPELSEQLAGEAATQFSSFVFVSDLRTGTGDEDIDADLQLQLRCLRAMSPAPSAIMFKFRMPYGYDTYEYLCGDVELQAWGPIATTETRLICTAPYTKMCTYDVQEYERRMYYVNLAMRCFGHYDSAGARGADDCYDCAQETQIWRRYCAKHGGTPAEMMDRLTAALHRPLHIT